MSCEVKNITTFFNMFPYYIIFKTDKVTITIMLVSYIEKKEAKTGCFLGCKIYHLNFYGVNQNF